MELSNQIALNKLQQYCVYQDRSHAEVRNKLLALEIYGDDLEEIMSILIQDKYLDEMRYAKSIVSGKFNIKKWGRNKIKNQLKIQQVSEYCIKKAMEEIDEEEYMKTLEQIYQNKLSKCTDESVAICINKARQYCISRGYETGLVFEISS